MNVIRIKYINSGKGMLVLNDGRTIKGGESFMAMPEQITKAFMDTVYPVNKKAAEKLITGQNQITDEPIYTVKESSRGWYDVVDRQGKQVNETKLRNYDARILADELNK